MSHLRILVQASSRSWSGGRDLCMNPLDGAPVVFQTIRRIVQEIPEAYVTVIAPAFDRGGELETAVFPLADAIYYGHDESPLNRMVDATQDLDEADYVLRVDGLHFCVDLDAALWMLALARRKNLDCVKLPDDFPVQFTSEVYRVGALRQLDKLLPGLPQEEAFRVHPRFAFFLHQDWFRCAYFEEAPLYSDAYLRQAREKARSVYGTPRQEVNDRSLSAGDQLSFHYELAARHLPPGGKVLDIACGDGYGSRMLAPLVAEMHGADISPEAIEIAQSHPGEIRYSVQDVTHMSFADEYFDAVVSLETIEHVDETGYLLEIYRVLKPGGVFILSTPQNSRGQIPVNPFHQREYSLEEITTLCGLAFRVKQVIGIKAGCIVIPGDPRGTNTVLICEKEEKS